MQFKILSHACLLIKSETHSVIIDPWLIGSCYWRSWWNFPAAEFDTEELSDVDAVLISHVHWDHWHGPTIKKFFKDKKFIVPDEPSTRSRRELKAIGIKDVVAIPHGKTIEIGDIKVTMHQFGLLLNDAALVVECDGISLLNANDAKIAGWSLRYLLDQHGPIDFAFRSHSSANPRICFQVTDDASKFANDDRDHYFRSFVRFMNAVNPKFAIPFASNHCHLHDDTYSLNDYISNPLQLRDFIDELPSSRQWELQVMLPGSSWSKVSGFSLRDESCFKNLSQTLANYRERLQGTLDRYKTEEAAVKISENLLRRFMKMLSYRLTPWKHRHKFILSLDWGNGQRCSYEINPETASYRSIDFMETPTPNHPVMHMPAIVFRDAILKNMFHHAGISKRCRFLAASQKDLSILQDVFGHLERVELGFIPIRRVYLSAMIKAYCKRWRELYVYLQAFWYVKVRRIPVYLAEEKILERTSWRGGGLREIK